MAREGPAFLPKRVLLGLDLRGPKRLFQHQLSSEDESEAAQVCKAFRLAYGNQLSCSRRTILSISSRTMRSTISGRCRSTQSLSIGVNDSRTRSSIRRSSSPEKARKAASRRTALAKRPREVAEASRVVSEIMLARASASLMMGSCSFSDKCTTADE